MSEEGNNTNLQELRDELLKRAGEDAVKIDLGAGQQPLEGFVGADVFSPLPEVQKVDLYTYPWPWADGSVDYFRASHFLEHIPDWNAHFKEIYRCLKPEGCYEIIVPYYWNSRWAQDPDHKQTIVAERFRYLMQPWVKLNKLDHYNIGVNFELIGYFELLSDDFLDQGYDATYMQWAKRHLVNVVDDIAVILRRLPLEV